MANINLKKRLGSLCLALLIALTLAVSFSVTVSADDESGFQIKIVHTNDIHARVQENAKSGIIGAEKLKSIINGFTDGADMSLVLDSGDLFHGQSIATLVKGASVAELIKACGYDAMTAGNHDWSYGADRLKELAAMAELDILVGNVVDEEGNEFFDNSYYIEEVTKNGQLLKVGVFGVIDPSVYRSTAPSNVAGLTFTDAKEYSKKAAAELKAMDCDIVIALSHTYDPAELAASVDGVDVWLAGHEHIDLDSSVTTPDGSTAYIFESGYYLYEVGLIELDCGFDADGDITVESCSKTPCYYADAAVYENDSEVTALLERIVADCSVILNQVVGTSPSALDGVWENLRIDETKLGRAVADAYLLETGADIAFENAGGIRASVEAGEVTYGDIIGVSPYGNYIVTKQITGKQLVEVLESSIDIQVKCVAAYVSGDTDAWPQSSGSYLQTGGVTVEYDPALEYGSRVLSVKVGGEELDEDKLYTVATNNYVAVSSYYTQLADAEEIGQFCACDEALIKYFSQDESLISASLSTAGMIKTEKAPDDGSTDSDDGESSENSGELETPPTSDSSVAVYFLLIAVSVAVMLPLSFRRRKESGN